MRECIFSEDPSEGGNFVMWSPFVECKISSSSRLLSFFILESIRDGIHRNSKEWLIFVLSELDSVSIDLQNFGGENDYENYSITYEEVTILCFCCSPLAKQYSPMNSMSLFCL